MMTLLTQRHCTIRKVMPLGASTTTLIVTAICEAFLHLEISVRFKAQVTAQTTPCQLRFYLSVILPSQSRLGQVILDLPCYWSKKFVQHTSRWSTHVAILARCLIQSYLPCRFCQETKCWSKFNWTNGRSRSGNFGSLIESSFTRTSVGFQPNSPASTGDGFLEDASNTCRPCPDIILSPEDRLTFLDHCFTRIYSNLSTLLCQKSYGAL